VWLKDRVYWTEKEAPQSESMAQEQCDGHGLRDEAGASRYLRMEGRRGRQENVLELVRLGARDAEANRRTALVNGPCCQYCRRSLGGNPGPLGSRTETAFMEELNSPFSVMKRKARGYRTVEHKTAMLYVVAGKLTLQCY
jgi:hypothetical protein